MSLYAKSVMAIFFLGFGFIAVICMMTLMGKSERKTSSTFLRRLHKITGAIFAVMYLVISYICLHYVRMMGEGMSTRAVFHSVLALALFIVLAFKLSIVQFYRQFLRYVPGLGMTVFSLAFAVFFTSAGYFFLVKGGVSKVEKPASEVEATADADRGQTLFDQQCSFCHYADRTESKLGPGLKGILKGETLPVSGKPATPENIIQQLKNPYQNMPSFGSLSQQEMGELLAYLKSL
jgi:cytochrome c2